MIRLSTSGPANTSRSAFIGGCCCAAIVALVILAMAPAEFPLLLVFGLLAIVAAAAGLRDPAVAVVFLLIAMFLRLVLASMAPVDPFLPAYAGVVAALLLWLSARHGTMPGLGWLEALMVLYVLWNFGSMIAPHDLGTAYPLTGTADKVYRFILTGTVIPFTMYLVGRIVYRTERVVRVLVWSTTCFGSYAALASIAQFHAPALAWPRYIVTAPNWVGRANGLANQPVVNGITLLAGFVAALTLATVYWRVRPVVSWLLYAAAAAMAYGVFLTHTRIAWIALLIVIVAGAAFARPRMPYLLTLGTIVAVVALNWSTFTSSDRDKGGVASVNEVDDRLNSFATSVWAIEKKPLFGWGIGRFTDVNTVHHQRYSQDIPWMRGYGISSHENELGIWVELGVVGILLWLAVLVVLTVKLVKAIRTLRGDGIIGRNLALLAALTMASLVISGFTVDLRFFDYPNALAFLLAGVVIGCAERATASTHPTTTVSTAGTLRPGGESVLAFSD